MSKEVAEEQMGDAPDTTAAANGASDSRDPAAFLLEITGGPVIVKLNSGVVFKGMILQGACCSPMTHHRTNNTRSCAKAVLRGSSLY